MPTKVGNYKYENSRQENAVIAAPAPTPCHCEPLSPVVIAKSPPSPVIASPDVTSGRGNLTIARLLRRPAKKSGGTPRNDNRFARRLAAFLSTLVILSASKNLSAAPLELDYMEYTTTAAAQAAYVSNSSVTATGGTITEVGGYRIHTFTASGTFTMNVSTNVEVLVVAGGGSGAVNHGGGGGAGGLIYNSTHAVTAQAYTVTVGAGGAQVTTNAVGNDGGNSVFGSLTAIGGGGGGGYILGTLPPGRNGGSGGGGGHNTVGGTSTQGSSGFGFSGGGSQSSPYRDGGGGGAGGAGQNGPDSSSGGNGGVGRVYSISGTATYYAGGGGAGNYIVNTSAGAGGLGGGGNGISETSAGSTAGAGGANTGGGGGGAGNTQTTDKDGGAGGSGIVIVRYPLPFLSYSEPSIKTQGSYAIKSSAPVTTSLNKTLTRTVSPTINLSDRTQIKFDIRATRTGSNIKIGIRDSGGTTTYITPNITSANNYQTIDWDISAISNANKDAIDRIIIGIVNADASNTFYIDNLFARWYPDAPTLNRVVSQSPDSIQWGWTDNSSGVDQEDGFRVYSSTAGLLSTRTADTTFWIETGLKRNKEYSRYIQAYNTAGSSNSATTTWRTKPGAFQSKVSQGSPTRTGANAFGFVGDAVWDWEVPVKSGSALTITAYIRYNSEYGGSSTKPKLTLSGKGISPTSISATSSAENAWELLTINAGTPSQNATLTLRAEGFSAIPGAKFYIDDVNVSQ